MKISDALGSSAKLATALFTAANASASAAQADGNAAPTSSYQSSNGDSVSLSELASNLSGDGLELFNKLSSRTRNDLASLVTSGKMTAGELNDALNGLLKSARKNVFWEEAGKYQAGLSKESVDTIQVRNAAEVEAAFDLGKTAASETGYLYGDDAAAMRARFANVDQGDGTDLNTRQNKLTPYLMSGTFATANTTTDKEVAAAVKLRSLDFNTTDLEGARRSLALESVLQLVSENKAMMSDWL
jgi:hypothetical protein